MTDPRIRGRAWDRARPAGDRPGSFEKGHAKLGGRKPGTRNVISADYKTAILEAAYRIGEDGNGKNGFIGYLAWVAMYHPAAFGKLLRELLPLDFVGLKLPEAQWQTADELGAVIRAKVEIAKRNPKRPKEAVQVESQSEWDWTGQPDPVGSLMRLAVNSPKHFCKLLAVAFLRPLSKTRDFGAGPPPEGSSGARVVRWPRATANRIGR